MTAAARAVQRHLLSMWADIPIGTRVIVRNWAHSTETMSGPYVDKETGVAFIRVTGWNGLEIELDRVSLAGPRAVTVADTIQPALPDPSAFADRPTAIIVTAILFFLTLGMCISAHLIAEGPMPPPWLCEEAGIGCDWREAAP